MWKNITKYLNYTRWATKVASWTKVPQLKTLDIIVNILQTILDIIKKRIIKINQTYSDEVNSSTETSGTNIENERTKPLSEQNNDVLREETRNRININSETKK